MKLYRIRDWDKLYENNRSRSVTDLSWVKMPNRHDGENYTAIITAGDGALIFSAWILMVQVASRCDPRGTLIKENGTPHTPLSLSLKTRAPQKWFEIALDYLESHTDWLDVEQLASDCQDADRQLPLGCASRARAEQNGTEQKEQNCSAKAQPSPDSLFKQRWSDEYLKIRGEKYAFQGGKDGAAVKSLIATGIPPDELISIAVRAWGRPDLFNCKQAVSLSGFYSRINEIRAELASSNKPDGRSRRHVITGRLLQSGEPDGSE